MLIDNEMICVIFNMSNINTIPEMRMMWRRLISTCLLACLFAIAYAQEEMKISGNVYVYQKKSDEIRISPVVCKVCRSMDEAERLAGEIQELENTEKVVEVLMDKMDKFFRANCFRTSVVQTNGKFTMTCKPGTFLLFVETQGYHTKVVKVKKGKTEYKNIGIESHWLPILGGEDDLCCHPECKGAKYQYKGKYPRFPGGRNAFTNYLCDRLQRSYSSQDTIRNHVEGLMELSFRVDKDGTVRNIKCEQSPDSTLTDEVISYLKAMPQWQAARKPLACQRVKLEFVIAKDYYYSIYDKTFTPYEKNRMAFGLKDNTRIAFMKEENDTVYSTIDFNYLFRQMGRETDTIAKRKLWEICYESPTLIDDRLHTPHIRVIGKQLSDILSRSKECITFVVDENLEPRYDDLRYSYNERLMTALRLAEEKIWSSNVIASSFAKDKHMGYMGSASFFKFMVHAYGQHQSICLSPDMIWLLISQGFSRYIYAHYKWKRDQLVTQEKNLVVMTQRNLLNDKSACRGILDAFSQILKRNTEGDLAETITAGFSTTRPEEKIASEITLMNTSQAYFRYLVESVTCGIPSIVLTGTREDWHDLIERTRKLGQYGLENWVEQLIPILTEFERAVAGLPDQRFWQRIVRQGPIDQLDSRTDLDGWILRFFPDYEGEVPDVATRFSRLPDDVLKVDFKYRISTTGEEYDLELRAGFIGAEKDTINNVIIPKIGWFLRHATDSKEDLP